jgi:peptide/nickel transport system permease protein
LRRSRRAVWSLRILYVLVFVGVFGDFIANDKPLYCKIEGVHYFPVFKLYAVELGLSDWHARFFQNEWTDHPYQAVVFPLVPYSANSLDLKNSNYRSPFAEQKVASTRWRHWLGTDRLGHDVLAGLIAGTRVALLVGLIAMSIATVIGILAGALAAYFGDDGFRTSRIRLLLNAVGLFFGWFYGFPARSYAITESDGNGALLTGLAIFCGILLLSNLAAHFLEKIPAFGKRIAVPVDLLVMRAIEVLNSVPGLLLLLSFVAVLQKSSIFYVMIIIGLIRWTGIARFLRAELLKIKHLGYVEAARALGFGHWRTLFRHALPNALGPVLITIAFGVASAILLESVLSFLGLGVGEEGVTWGRLLAGARRYPAAWWLALFPGGAIFVAVTIFNLIGEGLTEK